MTALSGATIREYLHYFFPNGDGDHARVREGKYYLTLGKTFLILPNGKKHGPDRPRTKPLVIYPGQSAYLSSAEHLLMPPNLIGLIGPRYTGAEMGMLFFGGMIVDPLWGSRGRWPGTRGQPLSFNVANVGREPLELRPGTDPIASLAFVWLDQPAAGGNDEANRAIELREELFASRKRRPSGALGLVEDLGKVRDEVDRMQAQLKTVVLFGVVVLAATLFSAVIAAILSLSNESGAAQISTDSWESIGWAMGGVTVGTLAFVGIFYLIVRGVGKGLGYFRRRFHG